MKSFTTILSFIIAVSFTYGLGENDNAITGEWLSASKDVKILIYEVDHKYFGKIVWGNRNLGKDKKNPDKQKHNNDILGTIIISDFTFNGTNKWDGGKIYDPGSGKSYSGTMKLRSANVLELRGYIGITLIGKTEILTKN